MVPRKDRNPPPLAAPLLARLRAFVTSATRGGSGIRVPELARIVGTDRPTILEIGANDGTHTLQFAACFRDPVIHCFEPEPRAIRRFRRNLRGVPNVRLVEAAAGAATGTVRFHRSGGQRHKRWRRPLPEGWDYSGSIRPPKRHLEVHPDVEFREVIEVPMLSIDDWAREHPVERVDLVWMDVQGAEREVLAGMRATLPRVRFLYTEFSDVELYEGQPNLAAILGMLPDFEVMERFPGDVLLRRRGAA